VTPDQRQDTVDFGEELQLKAGPLASAPRGRLDQLVDRLWGEADDTHRRESRLRIWLRASGQDTPDYPP